MAATSKDTKKPRAKVKIKTKASARCKAVPKAQTTRRPARKWSQKVTETSNAMDLAPHVFELDDPKKIAASLKRSAERSHRRKSAPYRSAMSMLTFYVNRAGHNLSAKRKRVLERAKDKLRIAFGKES